MIFELLSPPRNQRRRPIKIYYKLAHAQNDCISANDRIWSQDTRLRNGKCGKCYTVMSAPEFYDYMCNDRSCTFNWYEIIHPKKSSAFYLDIELEKMVDNEEFDHVKMSKRIKFVMPTIIPLHIERVIEYYLLSSKFEWNDDYCKITLDILTQFINEFENLEGINESGIWLTSCRGNKLSFHYINQNYVLDRNFLSMRVLCWLLSRKFWKKLNSLLLHVINDCAGPRNFSEEYVVVIFKLCMLQNQSDNKGWLGMHDTICDELVYTHNQAFRLIGNSKIKGSCFLTHDILFPLSNAKLQTLNAENNDMQHIMNANNDFRRQYLIDIGEDLFLSTLISLYNVPMEDATSYISPTSYPYIRKVQKFFQSEYSDRRPIKIKRISEQNSFNVTMYGSCLRFPLVDDGRLEEIIKIARMPIVVNRSTEQCIDADQTVVGVDLVEKKISEYEVGDSVYHECKLVSAAARRSSMCGIATGEILEGYNDNNFLYCHACQVSYAILNVYDPTRYKCTEVSLKKNHSLVTFSIK